MATFQGQSSSAGILISTENQATPGAVTSQTRTGAQGNYAVTGLRAGTYNV